MEDLGRSSTTVSKILEEGHVKSIRTPRRTLMNEVDNESGRGERVRYVETVAFGASFSLTTPRNTA